MKNLMKCYIVAIKVKYFMHYKLIDFILKSKKYIIKKAKAIDKNSKTR